MSFSNPGSCKKIRLAIVCSPLAWNGGTFKHLLNWCRQFNQNKVTVGLFCNFISREQQDHAQHFFREIDGIEFYAVTSLFPLKNFFSGGFLKFARALKRFSPDIVHSIFIQADIICSILGPIIGAKRHVSSWEGALIGNFFHSKTRIFVYNLLFRLAQRRIDRFVAISQATASDNSSFHSVPSHKIKVIHSGINQATFPLQKMKEQCKTVGLISRLSAEKRTELFIEAIPAILCKHPKVNFIIAGDGGKRKDLERLVQALNISDKVTFLGWCSDINEILKKIDISVFTSYGEGLPWAILESMSTGKPTIASAVGGIPEVIENGENGFLLENPDPELLAAKVCGLIEDDELRKKISLNARRTIESSFTLEKEVSALEKLYSDLLKNNLS